MLPIIRQAKLLVFHSGAQAQFVVLARYVLLAGCTREGQAGGPDGWKIISLDTTHNASIRLPRPAAI